MMHERTRRPYYAYVLRCWLEEGPADSKDASWRFSLEHVLQERGRRGFGSLEAMISFLRAELDAAEADRSRQPEPSP